ncbi:MAG: cupin domain-containing protein [Halobacteriales archaeon]
MTEIETLADLDGSPHATVFRNEPRTIRLALRAGEGVDPHRHPGRSIVLYLLEGALTLKLGDDTHELTAGDIARFDGEQEIAPVATADSTALIVLAPRAETETV